MVLKIRSMASLLLLIMLFSGVACGEEYSNLLLGGIKQEAPCVDCSKANNLDYYAIANELQANYFPMYYDDNELDNIGEVQSAAAGEATEQNGLNNDFVHGKTYDTILAYSGGTATALTVLANYNEYGVTCDTLILVSPMSAGISDELYAKIRKNIEEDCDDSYNCPNLINDILPASEQTRINYSAQVIAMLESNPQVVKNIIVITSPQDELMPYVSDIFQVRNFEAYTTKGWSDINPDITITTQEVPLTQYEDDGVEAHIQLFFGYAKTHLSNTDGGVIEFNPEGNQATVKEEKSNLLVDAIGLGTPQWQEQPSIKESQIVSPNATGSNRPSVKEWALSVQGSTTDVYNYALGLYWDAEGYDEENTLGGNNFKYLNGDGSPTDFVATDEGRGPGLG